MVPITFSFFRPQNPVPAVRFAKPVRAVPVHAVRTGSGSVRGHHDRTKRKDAGACVAGGIRRNRVHVIPDRIPERKRRDDTLSTLEGKSIENRAPRIR